MPHCALYAVARAAAERCARWRRARRPSGAGPSLLLRLLAGLDRPAAGSVVLDGRTPAELGGLPAWRARVAYVTQTPARLPGAPADTFAEARGYSSQRERPHGDLGAAASALLLEPSTLAQPWATLSGGQALRALLAVALALRPDVLLVDEPTAACDTTSAAAVEAALKASGAALVWVSHDPEQPARVGGRILRIGDHHGEQ